VNFLEWVEPKVTVEKVVIKQNSKVLVVMVAVAAAVAV